MFKTARKVTRNTAVLGASYTAGHVGSVVYRHKAMRSRVMRIHRATGKPVRSTTYLVHTKDFKRGAATAAVGYGAYRGYRHVKKKRKARS